jgi:hypothetical protein
VELSDDAKGLAACLWNLPIGERTILSFGMKEVQPTNRAKAALEELVSAGFLLKEERFPGGRVSYSPVKPMSQFKRFTKLGKFPLTEPLSVETRVAR